MLNAILYVAVNGCTWRGLPAQYGRCHTVYMPMRRWAKAGVLDEVFEEPQMLLLKLRIEVVSLDSTSIKVYPDGRGALRTMTCAGSLERLGQHEGATHASGVP